MSGQRIGVSGITALGTVLSLYWCKQFTSDSIGDYESGNIPLYQRGLICQANIHYHPNRHRLMSTSQTQMPEHASLMVHHVFQSSSSLVFVITTSLMVNNLEQRNAREPARRVRAHNFICLRRIFIANLHCLSTAASRSSIRKKLYRY